MVAFVASLLVAGIISSCKKTECECTIFPGTNAQALVDKHSKKAKSCADLENKIKAEDGVLLVSCSEK